MIRNLLLPALAAALLGGCVTGYDYRGGAGDYYYGQPSVDYQDDGYYSPYGYGGYGYPGGWSGMIGYGMGYGGGYGYGGYPYGYPYGYGYPYTPRPPVIVVRPDPRPHPHPRPHRDDDDNDRLVQPGPLPSGPARPRRPFEPDARPIGERMPLPQPSAPTRFPNPDRIQREPQRGTSQDSPPAMRQERDDGLKRHH
ncbi:hypothetical protein [Cognatiluteimonas profundi]|uniref:hypothetical protein n=1 Tax=Cognatiluteimonas profundi TaxID=2594501 RepID=UPI0018EF0403|nr:hypothetical protein [Lysobacter profundi]